jgi:hypothetical protein
MCMNQEWWMSPFIKYRLSVFPMSLDVNKGDLGQGRNLYYANTVTLIGSEVLTAVTVKSTVLWDVMPCSSLEFNQSFCEQFSRSPVADSGHATIVTCFAFLVCIMLSFVHVVCSACHLLIGGFLPGLLFSSEDGGQVHILYVRLGHKYFFPHPFKFIIH